MPIYPPVAVERAMKIQEVILRAVSGEILWSQAAEIIGISDRGMRRWRQRYEEYGYTDLFDRRRGRPSPKRVPLATVEKVLKLYRGEYFDFNVRHFVEKLHQEHDIGLSYTWVKTALQTAGLVAKSRKRGKHHKKRPRRPLPGMMLHVDGSTHAWLPGGDRQHDLVAVLDDANNQVYYARLVEQESTATVMAALREVIQHRGLFCSLYSDRGSHFVHTPKAGQSPDPRHRTQLGRALQQLGIELIPANSPQARGRCERFFSTWQGRVPQELRLRKIDTLEAANQFLCDHWMDYHNQNFTVAAPQPGTAFVRYTGDQLDTIFSLQHDRVVGNDNTVTFGKVAFQIEPQRFRYSLARCRVMVCEHLDKTITLHYGPHVLGRYNSQGELIVPGKLQRGKRKVA